MLLALILSVLPALPQRKPPNDKTKRHRKSGALMIAPQSVLTLLRYFAGAPELYPKITMPALRAYPAASRRKRTKRRINGKPPTASPGADSLVFIPLSSHHLPSYLICNTIILPFVNRDLPKNRDFFVNCTPAPQKTGKGGYSARFSRNWESSASILSTYRLCADCFRESAT